MRLRQVLLNLLNNAVKFTEKGEISISVGAVEETENEVLVEFAVSDSGIGIPRDKLEVIFEAFSQADGSITRKYGGTGLGLTISQRLVRKMGGEIEVDSEVGKGSTFRFKVWLRKGQIEEGVDEGMEGRGGMDEEKGMERTLRILLAEDDPANQKMTKLMLKKMGHRVDVANNGVEAVKMAQAGAYDVIFMDIQMPLMGGLEATQELRQAGVKTPILAMTASAMKGDRERFLEAGMDDYISKPIRKDVIHEALNQHSALKSLRDASGDSPLPTPETIAVELGLDHEEYREILREFIKDKKEEMQKLGDALAQGDTDEISRLAHKIKGSALNLRLDSLARPAASIEKAAKAGDISAGTEDWDALSREFKALGKNAG